MAAVVIQPVISNMLEDEPLTTGLLASQHIRAAIRSLEIQASVPISERQIQPASLDLRLGPTAYRVPISFLPGRNATVKEKISAFAMHKMALANGAVLERNCIYIIELMEQLALRKRTSATANPKSSTGRLDIFVRLITDNGDEFDQVRERYRGPLYVEVVPRTFSVMVRQGSCLNQVRIRRGSPPSTDRAIRRLNEEFGLLDVVLEKDDIKNGLPLTIDVVGNLDRCIGYKARQTAGLIDVDRISAYDAADFWEPVYPRKDGGLILARDDFYILASREAVKVPTTHAAELIAYDTLVGEFRVHYAGFFDPGFGSPEAGGEGSRAVLEVRSHEVPFLIEDGQVVGRLMYERLIARPDRLYGPGIGSSYQRQGLALSRQFKPA